MEVAKAWNTKGLLLCQDAICIPFTKVPFIFSSNYLPNELLLQFSITNCLILQLVDKELSLNIE